MAAQGSQVPYDPLLDPPLSPRLSLTGAGSNQATDFNPPNPRFFDPSTRSSSTSTLNYKGSDHGSISALKPPQMNGGSELTSEQVQRYRDDPESTKESLPMRDLSPVPGRRSRDLTEKNELYAAPRAKSKRKALIYGIICAALVILLIAIIIPVYLFVIKKSGGSSSGSSSGNTGTGGASQTSGGNTQTTLPTTGGDGSIVTKADGSTFVYNNTLGGFWVFDPANPLNESARAQSYSPPLSEQWKWGVDKIYG